MFSARRATARRSALALGCGTLAFLVGQLALGLAVERWLPAARDPEYASKVARLRGRCAEAPGRPLVLVLGSSRVQLGLRAGSLDSGPDERPALVFNFGLGGCASLMEAVCLRRLLHEGVRPDLLVLEVLPATLNQCGARPVEEEWLDANRLRSGEAAFLARYQSDPRRSACQWLKGRGLPCVWHHDNLRSLLALGGGRFQPGPEGLDCATDPRGWVPYAREDVPPEQRHSLTDYARHVFGSTFGDFRLAEQPARALDDVLALCRREGIPVALLLMPEGPAFRAWYTPSMRAGLDAYLHGLGERWSAPLIDARDWLDSDAFLDEHHLLPRGAAAFTERFRREALGPLLQTLPRR